MSGSVALFPVLDLCDSAPHRAVLGALAVALGYPRAPSLLQDLTDSAPEQIAAIANQGHAQTILHTAFTRDPALQGVLPRDLLIYFEEMQRANHQRNRAAVTQLAEIAAILAPKGIPILTLKGAADLLHPLHDPPAHRYISDLDLLIPQDRIGEAAHLLRQAKGLRLPDRAVTPGPHHHLAQISPPDWPLTVELHLRPGSDVLCRVLGADAMFERSQPSTIGGVSLPCLEDRLLHHVLHGMELRHDTAALNLRMLADHAMYRRIVPEKTQKQALKRLKPHGFSDWLSNMDDLVRSLEGHPPPAHGWAETALRRFADPKAAQARDTRFWVGRYLGRLRDSPAYRRQVIGKLVSPRAWAAFLRFHRHRRDRFR